uniref:clathrin light chain B isoform X4 n=1 Tax=Centroberyx gerrardi TaxID=166262 RepID=UPI003AAC955B
MADNGAHPAEEDPAAAFLAQQESEIAVIENDGEGFGEMEGTDGHQSPIHPPNYDTASKAAEAEWKEKARKELEDWHVHQNEQMEKNKANNRASEEAFLAECDGDSPGSEWERVARLCDFNPKTNKQAKDVSRMRSVLISLKQTPLVR